MPIKTTLPANASPRRGSNNKEKAGEVWARINAFLHLKSANTQRTYVGIVREWCEFLGVEAGSAEASRAICSASDLHAVAYKEWLEGRPGQKPRLVPAPKGGEKRPQLYQKSKARRDGLQQGLTNATIAKKFAALRRIYRMLMAAVPGIEYNPFDTDRVPPPPSRSGQRRPTEMLDYQMVREVLALPDTSTAKGLRDLVVLSVLFGGGLRRSEVVNLRIGDVRRTNQGTVFLRLRATKTRRDADQALPEWAAEYVLRLVQQRKKEGAELGDYLIVSYRGQGGRGATNYPLSDSGLYHLFKNYCLRAGAGKFLSPHSARATAITKLLSDGLNHREVQEFSRHASVQMVEIYDKRRIGIDENPATTLDYGD